MVQDQDYDDYDDFDDDLDQVAEEEPRVRPRASLLTVVLCVLNIAAAAAFAVLLMMDHSKRQEWSYAIFLHDLARMGLPLEQEADGTSGSRATDGKQVVPSEAINRAFTKVRGLPSKGSFFSVEENFEERIKPQHLSEQVLNDHFKHFAEGTAPASWTNEEGRKVKTLEDELRRLKEQLPGAVAKAAQDYAASVKDTEKLDKLRALRLSLGRSPHELDKISKEMAKLAEQQANAAAAAGNFYEDLRNRLADAAERRMLYEILMPIEHFRSAPYQDDRLQKVADKEALKTSELYEMAVAQFDAALADEFDPKLHFGDGWKGQKRNSVEKRNFAAYLLFTVGQVRRPDGEFLFAQGPSRARAVVGLHKDLEAATAYTDAWQRVAEQLAEAITYDRDGVPSERDQDKVIELKGLGTTLNLGKKHMVGGFVNEYKELLVDLRKIADRVKHHRAELADFKSQEATHQVVVKDLTKRVDGVTSELVEARQKSARLIRELRNVQKEFFEAQSDLADAHAKNLALLRKIRAMATKLQRGSGQ